MCLSQGPQRSDAGEARTGASWSWVKHSSMEPVTALPIGLREKKDFNIIAWIKQQLY